jgi:DNA cross-link repair 1A protein
MAPSKTSRTPAKKTAKPIASAKFSSTKGKPQRNASILSFFKKEVDEDLFVAEKKTSDRAIPTENQPDDLYGNDDEKRYNEVESPVKRRKTSPVVDEPESTPSTEPEDSKTTLPIKPKAKKPIKKNPLNPFLEDSSDEEDLPVRPPPPSKLRRSPTNDGNGITPAEVKDSPESQILRPPSRNGSPDKKPESKPEPEQEPTPHPDPDVVAPPLRHEASTIGDFTDMDMDAFDGLEEEDDEFGGEEFRERRFMEEQARLEDDDAGRERETDSCDDDLARKLTDDTMTESCPICGGNLSGVTADDATAHVNACLDGNPIPLQPTTKATPKPTASPAPDDKGLEVEAKEMGKRFARAAIPRPPQANPIILGGTSSGTAKPGSNSAFTKLMSGNAEDAAWATAAATEHASRGKAAYERTCPFYKIMPGFFICVDAFRYGAVQGCKAYFLSHFHSDHYIGLTAKWTHGPIYCSKVTGSLVRNQLRTAAQYVVELEFEQKVPVPDTDGVFVTMIPANHCPGSSLFLFEKTIGGRTQRILHCGDFRACPAHIAHPQLRPEAVIDAVGGRTRQQKIDVCYLDTTYLNPRYSFPPQENVIRACADLCVALNDSLTSGDEKEWDSLLRRREGGAPPGVDSVSKFFSAPTDKTPSAPKPPAETSPPNAFTALRRNNSRPPRLLIICGTYSIGKERICKAIAQALGTRIFASAAKARIIAQLGDPELTALLTSDPLAAQVHMQMLMEIRAETLADYLDGYRNHFTRIVGFRPSGWNYRPSPSNGGAGLDKIHGLAGSGALGTGKNVTANMPPASLPMTHLLHGPGWRTRFGKRDLVPQRGSGREAMCFGVPYSEHSSFRELAMFVMSLRIEKIVPTVNVGSDASRKRMKGWIDRWMTERRKGGLVRVLEEEEGVEVGKDKDGKVIQFWQGKDGKGGGAYW